MDSLNNEIFRLRTVCKELQDRLDRLLLIHPHGVDTNGQFGRILEEISRRDEKNRRSAIDLIN